MAEIVDTPEKRYLSPVEQEAWDADARAVLGRALTKPYPAVWSKDEVESIVQFASYVADAMLARRRHLFLPGSAYEAHVRRALRTENDS